MDQWVIFLWLSRKRLVYFRDQNNLGKKAFGANWLKWVNFRFVSHLWFLQAMDTLRDKQVLESLCSEGKAPWKNLVKLSFINKKYMRP